MKYSITIKTKLIGLIAILGILSIVLMGITLKQKWDEARAMTAINESSHFLALTNAFVHECQKERGATGVFLASKGAKFADVLREQRQNTDDKLKTMEAYLKDFAPASINEAFASQFESAQAQRALLAKRRSQVDKQSIAGSDAIGFYTGMNAEYLRMNDRLRELAVGAEMASTLGAYSAFLQAKERSGIERAVLSITFSADAFPEGLYERFVTLIAEQKAFTMVFQRQAQPHHVEFYEKQLNDDSVKEVERMRDVARAKAATGGFGIEGPYWFNTITKKIELLKGVEDYLTADVVQMTEGALSGARKVAFLYGVGVLLLVAVVGVGLILILSVTRPIVATADTLKDISQGEGDLTARLDVKSGDEIGRLSQYFNDFVEKIEGVVADVAGNTSALATTSEQFSANSSNMAASSEDMNLQCTSAAAAVEEASASIATMATGASEASTATNSVAGAAEEVSANLSTVGAAVEELSANMATIASNTESVTSSVNTTAAAIEEMNSSLSSVAANCTQGSRLSGDADGKARSAGETMATLNAAAEKVDKVVETISGIAAQTNLLALNATIEAASAGEAGKGFAVVANEVKELAKQTAMATDEISQLIGEMQEKTGDAVQAAEEISGLIVELNGTMQTIASTIEEQSTTTNEISSTISSAALAVQGVATSVQEVAHGATEISQSAQEATTGASEIAREVAEIAMRVDEISSQASDASVGMSEVSQNIQGLNQASETVKNGADETNTGSDELAAMATNLRNLIGHFKVGDQGPGN